MHTTCHAGSWDAVRDITTYQMQAFAILLDKLAAVEVAPGVTALDASVIYGTSEYGEGWKHGVQEMPVVLAGGGYGKLQTMRHVREPGGNIVNIAPFTEGSWLSNANVFGQSCSADFKLAPYHFR